MDADLSSYCDSIPHVGLMARLGKRISEGAGLARIEALLRQDVIQGMARWTPTGGTPQGAGISPLPANVYLHPVDCPMRQKGYRMVRYADDVVGLCRRAEEAQAALAEGQPWVEANGLVLNQDKTRMGECREAGHGVDFLGYRFEAGAGWVRKKSLLGLRERIRAKTGRTRGVSLSEIVVELNPMLRGWCAYFKHAHPMGFRGVEGFIRRRLRAVLRKQAKRPGMGRCLADHLRWPTAFFAAQGLFTMTEAHALASQSR